jgi:putative membrane protein
VNPRKTALRVAATSGLAAIVCGMVAAPAVAADGDVDVVNTETVQVYTSPTGEVETQRVYEQLILTGTGSVDLTNPISTDGLRNLEGFDGVDVEGGDQVTEMTVDGEEHLRTVSDFEGDLPLDVSVSYKLDG